MFLCMLSLTSHICTPSAINLTFTHIYVFNYFLTHFLAHSSPGPASRPTRTPHAAPRSPVGCPRLTHPAAVRAPARTPDTDATARRSQIDLLLTFAPPPLLALAPPDMLTC